MKTRLFIIAAGLAVVVAMPQPPAPQSGASNPNPVTGSAVRGK